MRFPIRDLYSKNQPRVFDAIIENDDVELEVKQAKGKTVRIRLDDVIRQIDEIAAAHS